MNVCAVLDHNFCFGDYRGFDRVFQVVEGRRVMLWLGSHSGQVSMLRVIYRGIALVKVFHSSCSSDGALIQGPMF